MIGIIFLINLLFLFLVGFLVAYLALLSILALGYQKMGVTDTPRLRKFAFLVPAHNEEITIGKTLESMSVVDYPSSLFDIVVVADNCTDRTAEKAQAKGAVVYQREDPTLKGKGYALRFGFQKILSHLAYEAIVVVDADSTVSQNFLRVANKYLDEGALVIQTSDLVPPQPSAWSSEVMRLGFTLYNYVRPLGRRVIRCSAGLRGNGMVFSREILQRVPWQAYSLAEDLEYGLMVLLHGISVRFAPEATVWATMPQQEIHAETQRARWEGGRFPIIKHYVGKLAGAALRLRSFKPFDALLDLITPPLANLVALCLGMMLANAVLWLLGIAQMMQYVLWWGLVIGLAAVHVLVGLFVANSDQLLYRALLHVPRYAVWKLTTYVRMFTSRGGKEWVRTPREAD